MTTASKATRHAARLRLARNPTALECVRVAAAVTSMDADVVVFDEHRVFVAASTTPGILVARPMTPAEQDAASSPPAPVHVHDGAPRRPNSASAVVPIRIEGELVAGLSLRGERSPSDWEAVQSLARLIAAVVVEEEPVSDGFAQKVLGGLRDTVLVVGPSLDLLWASPGAVSLVGHNPAHVVGQSAADFIHPDDLEETLDSLVKITEGGEVYRLVVRIMSTWGEWVTVEVTGTDMTADPDVGGIVLSLRDGHHADEVDRQLERSRALSGAIVEGLNDGLIATDRYGRVSLVNSVARVMFGIDDEAIAARLSLDQFDLFAIDGRPVDLLEPTDGPTRCLLPLSSEIRYLDCVVQAVAESEAETFGRVVVLTDVTAEHRASEYLREQAMHDQLTGLANRRQMEARLSELSAAAGLTTIGACFIDLDGFKLVNDNHGHRAGDEVIRIAAKRLDAVLRKGDLLVRHGGDEFVAILVDVDEAKAQATAERLRDALATPYWVGSERFDLTASIGVATAGVSEMESEVLLQHADIALYEAKGNGRDRVQLFDASLAEVVGTEERQRRLLRDALDEDRVVMHFQPLVDSASEQTLGFEALARVVTGDGTLLTPAHFLDAVSHTGLMWDLDRAAFRLSCDAARLLGVIDPLRPPYVACNFSSVSLTHPEFVEFVTSVTNEAGVSPAQICIELTESAAFDGGGRSRVALHELERLGYQLALDDFGTGYSSLAHLRDLPITTVKVDRSFVEQLTEHSSERAIAEAVVSLAHDLHLGVVAEGVETADQLEQARQMGFETIQGWHFSHALPIDRCLELWRETAEFSSNG